MAEKLVMSLIVKIETRLERELQLENKILTDVKKIKNELGMIVPIIRAADASKDINDGRRAWLQQVEEAASLSEDIVDELMYYLARPSTILPNTRKYQARHCIDSAMRKMISMYTDIFNRAKRYESLFGITDYSADAQVNHDPQEDALFTNEAQLVGIEDQKEELLELLLKRTPDLKVIPVVGMGGIGKTTLVKQIHNDAKVKSCFNSHAWITVSRNMKLEALFKDLIRQLCSEMNKPFPDGTDSMGCTQLKQRVHDELLKQKKYEIVVDDVWSIQQWLAIKNVFPDNECGSRVVITTRNNDVASNSSKNAGPFPLKTLPADKAMILLCKIVFPGDRCPDHLLNDATEILRKCDGLPIAIVAISSVLVNKEKAKEAEWNKVNKELAKKPRGNTGLQSEYKILALSYYDLPYNLKSCFLHMGVFPENHLIGRRRLIRMWIAEGFADAGVDETVHTLLRMLQRATSKNSLIET